MKEVEGAVCKKSKSWKTGFHEMVFGGLKAGRENALLDEVGACKPAF